MLSRPCLATLGVVLLAGCASRDPLGTLPPADRAALLGAQGASRGLGVNEMLARARTAPTSRAPAAPAPAAEPLVLRFAGGAAQPDQAQRAALDAFAGRLDPSRRILVMAHRPATLAGADALIGQRRAVAVARLLEPRFPNVETRFDPAAVPDTVVVVPDGSLPQ